MNDADEAVPRWELTLVARGVASSLASLLVPVGLSTIELDLRTMLLRLDVPTL